MHLGGLPRAPPLLPFRKLHLSEASRRKFFFCLLGPPAEPQMISILSTQPKLHQQGPSGHLRYSIFTGSRFQGADISKGMLFCPTHWEMFSLSVSSIDIGRRKHERKKVFSSATCAAERKIPPCKLVTLSVLRKFHDDILRHISSLR